MNLTNLGVGLGGFFQGYNDQQQAAARQALAQLYRQQQLNQLRLQKQQEAADALLFPAFASGQLSGNVPSPQTPMPGASSVPMTAGGGNLPFTGPSASPPPSAPLVPPPGSGLGRIRRNLYGRDDSTLDLIQRDESPGGNVRNFRYDPQHTAQGYFQITNTTWRETAPKAGVDLSQYPNAMSAPYDVQRSVAAQLLKDRGTQPWSDFNPKLAADLGRGVTVGSGGGAAGGDAGFGKMYQNGMAMLQKAMQPVDPSLYGRLSVSALAQQIEKANPGADPTVKMLALERGMKLLAPEEQLRTQQYMMQNRAEIQLGMLEMREALIGERGTAGRIVTDAEGRSFDVDRRGVGHPIRDESGNVIGGIKPLTGGAAKTPTNVKVTDDSGKVLYSGAAQPQPDGSFRKPDGSALPEGTVTLASKSGEGAGRLSETQNQRLMIGGNQVSLALRNLSEMPEGATLGIFQGLGQERGDALSEAVKRTLANTASPQSTQTMAAVTRGLSRGLATIEAAGAAQGLVGLSQQMIGELPAEGDSNLTILTKLADMRQIVEGAYEVMGKSDRISPDQKKQMQVTLDRIRKAIPYTVEDVIKLASNPDEKTISDFARGQGLGGGDTGAIPVSPDQANDPDGTTYNNGAYVKRGDQIVPVGQ